MRSFLIYNFSNFRSLSSYNVLISNNTENLIIYTLKYIVYKSMETTRFFNLD